ncbi:alpha-tocopherol transfer protein-like isoform X1 [Agrilus planipennis]|uniref:Alpha-tocopherol transfer protein-like isoform X1 n=2 Tax=Agrilus planipennis TaxID=224129 RepID=A0A7F5R0K1_AGRPL|nr:alpha-tocopherol transfer protein-like isoform X1 [Agrilus planipennis]XP_025831175.1 alpha-tocopherol transfer protein-like isoform X1 [Agrilus planipennis]XP_025831176.1 alpha-tocopherol transfer protein-like isoform X1 [Agrilus planipennis]XP_025831177.1 alpha-tocopherol transfer protein-like isoform X1 [Agrilus planipennis]
MAVVVMKPVTESIAETMLTDMERLPSLQLGNFTLEFELGDLSPEMQEVARKELRENPDLKREAVEELRELLKEDKELKVPYDNDAWLVRFLRPCKFYPKSAYDLIKRYYAFKVKHSDVYNDLLPSRETNIFEQNILTVQPNRDQFGRRILVIELGKKWNHKKCTLDEVFKGCVLFLEAAMLEPATQVAGAVVIFDMDGLTLQQTWQFTPPFAKRIVDWLQDSVPLRIKNIHIVNQPYVFNMVFALFKPFLREKLKSRIIFHGTDRKSLHKHMAPKCLPECYGGTLEIPRIDGKQWLELLLLCDQEFKAINSYGYKKN